MDTIDILKDILLSWIKGTLSIVVPILAVLVLGWIIFNTGNPYGRYVDFGENEIYMVGE
jgi:hypothetical protein